MGNITIADITLVLSGVMLCMTVFQLVAIMRGTAVTARVIGYDESDNYNPEFGTNVTNLFPIYRYSYQGVTKTHRSRFAIWLNWVRKDTNRIYISRSGKVFEKEGILCTCVAAIILFIIV